jgi:hypothetical protein
MIAPSSHQGRAHPVVGVQSFSNWAGVFNTELMSTTDPLESFINGNFDVTRCTFSDEIQLIGTDRSRPHGLTEAKSPDQQRYECCQGDQPIYGFAAPRLSRRC